MKKLLPLVLITTALLQACGSSNSKSTSVNPTTTTPTTVAEVHHIQPQDIPEYIETFKQQQAQLQLQFDGQQSAISFIDMSMENKFILAKYSAGVVRIGFDLEEEKPVSELIFMEGDASDPENFEATRILQGTAIEVTEDDDNYIYTGSAVDTQTQNSYPVRLVFNESLISGGASTLVVEGEQATISGTLGTQTYIDMQEMLNGQTITTLVFDSVDGSVNDAINMHTGRLIRQAGLTTLMPADGEAYSGGVDLFAAGVERKYQTGGKLGVHSWCCSAGKPANELGEDHEAHGAQLTYFREMMGAEKGPKFYFFTINAAPFDGVHIMSEAELSQYALVTD
ncbi:hypothetical protein SG34_014305 [Thalassomonas viridans]|uniref:Alpha/beta hydrolase n=1 Tax=Thalassomonas viridans TaxID=137584 RepID=A0AAE9Z7I2_9GAMM|nr:hypothetical protein [Thalassomonas viridans]WDE07953.1 hypothetical protein SG34_014305 [Thalassomonas viridans]